MFLSFYPLSCQGVVAANDLTPSAEKKKKTKPEDYGK